MEQKIVSPKKNPVLEEGEYSILKEILVDRRKSSVENPYKPIGNQIQKWIMIGCLMTVSSLQTN